jgi:hypothetical protein
MIKVICSTKAIRSSSAKMLSGKLKPRVQSTKNVRNIHTIGLSKGSRISKLKQLLGKTPKQLELSDTLDYHELISVKTLSSKQIPQTANITPTYEFMDKKEKLLYRKISELSEESGLFYLEEPKLGLKQQNHQLLKTNKLECKNIEEITPEKDKKFKVQKPRILICSREAKYKNKRKKRFPAKKSQKAKFTVVSALTHSKLPPAGFFATLN